MSYALWCLYLCTSVLNHGLRKACFPCCPMYALDLLFLIELDGLTPFPLLLVAGIDTIFIPSSSIPFAP